MGRVQLRNNCLTIDVSRDFHDSYKTMQTGILSSDPGKCSGIQDIISQILNI